MTQLILTAEILTAALEGFEAQRNRLDTQIAEIRHMLNGDAIKRVAADGDLKPKRTVSAAAQRKMAIAQRLRWKKVKQAAEPKAPAAKPRRKRSAAARMRMALAQKKRWAAIKAAAVSTTATAKKASTRQSGLKNVAAVSAKMPRVSGRKGAAKKKVIGGSQQAKTQAARQ